MRRSLEIPIIGSGSLRIAAPMLMVDAVLCGLFLMWAYAMHHDLTELWVYGQMQFSLNEGALTERWGSIKLAVAVACAAMIARPRRQSFYWGLTALLATMLLSDTLALHERMTAAIVSLSNDRLNAIGVDPFAKAALAGGPLTLMALGLMTAATPDRAIMVKIGMPALVLGGWSVIMDSAHSIYLTLFQTNKTIATLIEEGGEGLLITLVTVTIAGRWAQSR